MKFKKAASVLRYVLDILADLAAIIEFILSVVGQPLDFKGPIDLEHLG